MKKNIKKGIITVIGLMVMIMVVGCKKDTPAAAVEAPTTTETPVITITEDPAPVVTVTEEPTPVITEEPTIVPTDTPTPAITHVAMSDVVVFDVPVPDADKAFLQQLHETHIEPFLHGYEVEKIEVGYAGGSDFGYTRYAVLYTCQKGSVTLYFNFTVFAKSYENDLVKDEVFFDRIAMVENWDIIAEYENALGLSNYINK